MGLNHSSSDCKQQVAGRPRVHASALKYQLDTQHNSLDTVRMNVFLNFALTGMKVPHYFARWSAEKTTRRKHRARDSRGGCGEATGMPRKIVHGRGEGEAGDELVRRAEMIASMLPHF